MFFFCILKTSLRSNSVFDDVLELDWCSFSNLYVLTANIGFEPLSTKKNRFFVNTLFSGRNVTRFLKLRSHNKKQCDVLINHSKNFISKYAKTSQNGVSNMCGSGVIESKKKTFLTLQR